MIRSLVFATVLSMGLGSIASAGSWAEVGDAGQFPFGGSQVTIGTFADPFLTSITGATDSAAGDWVDAYEIYIPDPAAFSIISSGFDTRMWLADPAGLSMANDDDPAGGTGSALGPVGLWPAGTFDAPRDPLPGWNILVISGFSNEIWDAADVGLVDWGFPFDDLMGVSPLVGPITNWEHDDALGSTTPGSGAYTITMSGVEYHGLVPEPGTLALAAMFAMALSAVGMRKRLG